MTAAQVLMRARRILTVPGRWTRWHTRVETRDADGNVTYRHCVTGAVLEAGSVNDGTLICYSQHYQAVRAAITALNEAAQQRHSFAATTFNDRQTEVGPVIELIDDAIKLVDKKKGGE